MIEKIDWTSYQKVGNSWPNHTTDKNKKQKTRSIYLYYISLYLTGSSFKWRALWQLPGVRVFWYSLYNSWKFQRIKICWSGFQYTVCQYIRTYVKTNASNSRTHYWLWIRIIGFHIYSYVSTHSVPKNNTHAVFFRYTYNLYQVLQKKTLTDRCMSQNCPFWATWNWNAPFRSIFRSISR